MQTLRFYTRRVFAVVFVVFFTLLTYFATRQSSEEHAATYMGSKHARQLFISSHPGEQLSFQSQPAPALDTRTYAYNQLRVNRTIDEDLVRRIDAHLANIDLHPLLTQECKQNTTLSEYWLKSENRVVLTQDSWERFYAQIGTCELYHDDHAIDELLYDLNKMPIKHTAIMEGGTQVKLILTFENEKQAVFKPMRYGRDYETDPNHFYFGDFERHTAEIATFHMDRIMGYRRAVPTVGRVVSMMSELRDNAEKRLKKTFFVSPAKNHCFVGKCDYYCDTTHAICATPDLKGQFKNLSVGSKEGSVQVFLPDDITVPRKHNKSPYRRTYSKKTQVAEWQVDMDYCTLKVKTRRQYAHGRRLLDLVDLHIMDYLIINQDRHHYETFAVFPNEIPSYALHLDNGRAFGRTDIDDEDIMMPLRQCCVIRPSTLLRLLNFYRSKKGLTETLHQSLSKDPISPVLAFKHYDALERRLGKVMRYVLECMDKLNGRIGDVVMNEYHNAAISNPAPGEDIDASEDETDTIDNAGVLPPGGAAPPQPPVPQDAVVAAPLH